MFTRTKKRTKKMLDWCFDHPEAFYGLSAGLFVGGILAQRAVNDTLEGAAIDYGVMTKRNGNDYFIVQHKNGSFTRLKLDPENPKNE